MIRLVGYTDEEKEQIAHRYLIPRQLQETGLRDREVKISDDTLRRITRRYTREAGVRELERTIGRVCRKAATQFSTKSIEASNVTMEDLVDLLGPEKFFIEDARQELEPGVAAGLAWTEAGGEVLYVEAVRLPDGKGLTLTGQLGDVMKESATAARSYVVSKAEELGIEAPVLEGGVPIHVPAGATPKDGPSAGVTMAVALASLYSGHAARRDTAMTGEITLSGLVLPVGGIKEKVLAAGRAGLLRILLPQVNEKDLRDIPEDIATDFEFVFVQCLDDVFAAAIPSLSQPVGVAMQ